MKKITPSDLRREAQAMIRDGSMPSLETLLQAIAEAREKYGQQIKVEREAQRRDKRKPRTCFWILELLDATHNCSVMRQLILPPAGFPSVSHSYATWVASHRDGERHSRIFPRIVLCECRRRQKRIL
jgi:hypothetical protein